MTLDLMRETQAAMCSREIADAMIKRKGIEVTPAIVARIQKNILAVLHRLITRRILREVDASDERGVMQWEII